MMDVDEGRHTFSAGFLKTLDTFSELFKILDKLITEAGVRDRDSSLCREIFVLQLENEILDSVLLLLGGPCIFAQPLYCPDLHHELQ